MSVATELPPIVYIPDRARRTSGLGTARPHLALVPACAPAAPAIVPVKHSLPKTAPLRLTRRGVLVLSAVLGLVGLLMLTVAYLSVPAPAAASRTAQPGVVTVQAGDTLWSIAQRVAPGRDPRAVVDQLRSRNHLVDAALIPGQTLKVG